MHASAYTVRLTALVVGLLLAAVAPATAQHAQHSTEADQARIAALIERTAAANNAGDVEAWVALFGDDFVYMAPGSPPVTSRDALREVARAGFRHDAAIRIEPAEIEVHGDWAFARSQVTGRVTLAGSGEVVQVDVKQLAIYRRQDGEWRIARLIMNGNG